jgi:hypothetical protein
MATAKKKKPVITKRDLKAAAKEARRILKAMVAADFPEEGVVVDGWRYKPLDFGPEWREECELSALLRRTPPDKLVNKIMAGWKRVGK